MTTNLANIPVDEIRALADERERYEGWLRALDARRAQTPPHVYDRVRTDYDGRLGRVLDRLGAHLPALLDGETTLARREDELSGSLAERQDELAEIELRTAVGEFEADEGERLRGDKEGEVRELEATRGQVEADLATLRDLTGRATPPDGYGASGASAAVAAPAAAAWPEPDAAPATTTPDEAPASPAAAGDPDASGYRGEDAPEHFTPPAADAPVRAPSEPTPAWGVPTIGGESAAPREQAPPAGPASYAAAGMPEPEKTLRCPDCGAMNFPTEWYCERCGGELAAL